MLRYLKSCFALKLLASLDLSVDQLWRVFNDSLGTTFNILQLKLYVMCTLQNRLQTYHSIEKDSKMIVIK